MNAEIKALIEKHFKLFNAQDLKGVMDTYASDQNIVLMGTGPGENYLGEEAIGGAYDQFFNRFDPGSLTYKYDWITIGTKGNSAWLALTMNVEGTLKQQKGERVFNMSGFLEKIKGKWQIVSMHFSRLGAEQQQGA